VNEHVALEIIRKVQVEQEVLFVFGQYARPDRAPKWLICHGVNSTCCSVRGGSGAVEGRTPLDAVELYREAAVTVLLEWSEGKSSSERNALQRLGWLHMSLRNPTGSSVQSVDRRQGAQVTLNSMCSTSEAGRLRSLLGRDLSTYNYPGRGECYEGSPLLPRKGSAGEEVRGRVTLRPSWSRCQSLRQREAASRRLALVAARHRAAMWLRAASAYASARNHAEHVSFQLL